MKLPFREILIYTAAYLVSMILTAQSMYVPSGIVLIVVSAYLAWDFARVFRREFNPVSILSLSWVGGMGLAAMKLSGLATRWELMTWAAFYAAYACFIIGYYLVLRFTPGSFGGRERSDTAQESAGSERPDSPPGFIGIKRPADGAESSSVLGRRILISCNIIAALSVAALVIEAVIMGYVPLFTVDTPHAYSYFHVSGVHYFTILCVLLPALAVCFLSARSADGRISIQGLRGRLTVPEWIDISVCASLGIIIPVLIVSRYHMLFAVMLALSAIIIVQGGRLRRFTGSMSEKNGRRLAAVSMAAAFITVAALYIFITVNRAHSVDYLNGIFEMKYDMPIFISQPYIYVANNFDNFNCLVENLTTHTYGLKMLYPFFALTGLKLIRPELTAFPIYITKEELTTLTLIYDAYYDFGLAGVIAFMLALGAAMAALERMVFVRTGEKAGRTAPELFLILIYAQCSIYLALSFFTTWYSNPTTWFLFVMTAVIFAIFSLNFQSD